MNTPLHRTKLTKQLFDALASYIVGARLQPGDALPSTAALCEQYGTSRPVVREALSALEAIGLVEVRSGRNTVVRELDGHLIQLFLARALQWQERPWATLMEVRVPLEVQAAHLAAERADAAAISRMNALLEQMDAAIHDTASYPRLDVALHMEIARSTGNRALLWFSESIREQLMEVMVQVRLYREANTLVGDEQDDHVRIVRAIAHRNSHEAASAMQEHLEASARLVDLVESAVMDRS